MIVALHNSVPKARHHAAVRLYYAASNVTAAVSTDSWRSTSQMRTTLSNHIDLLHDRAGSALGTTTSNGREDDTVDLVSGFATCANDTR